MVLWIRAIFRAWLKTQLLPNIPENSLIIFDNAPYHNTLTEDSFPQRNTKKNELQQWLKDNKIPFENWLLKPDLYDLCCKHAPPPNFFMDQIIEEYGCHIRSKPQYHPELQPIEHIWGIVKSEVARTQVGEYTMESLKKRLGAALKAVTPSICKNTFQHVRKEENYYWKVDEEIDNISKP